MPDQTSIGIKQNQRLMEIDGVTYKMDFDLQALSYAEQVYLDKYGRGINVSEIITELIQVKLTAVTAFSYGALRSAGEAVTWEKYTKEIFTFDRFDYVFNIVSEAIIGMFAPANNTDEEPGDEGKNSHSRGGQ